MNDSYMGGFNNPLSRGSSLSRERLLVDADRLFSIDWLIRRLLIEIQGSLTPEAIAQHHKLFSTLRQQPDLWFAWQMLRAHHASLAKVEEFRQMFPEGRRLIEALNEEREDTIKKFMRFVPSKRWDSLRDDDRSWREYARLLFPMKDKNAQIEQEFFLLVDYICVLTDGLCGRWNQLTPVSEADSADISTSTPDLDAVQARAEFKAMLKGPWLDKYCSNKAKYDTNWREKFVEALFKSPYAQTIIESWADRSLVDMFGIIGILKDEGVMREGLSDLALARSVLACTTIQKKDKTISKYIGDAKKHPCYYWVKEYLAGQAVG
jgi:hypothetical protein